MGISCAGTENATPYTSKLPSCKCAATPEDFLSDGFNAQGEVSLLGASIGGQLVCRGGTFTNEDGDALNGATMQVELMGRAPDGLTKQYWHVPYQETL